MVNRSVCPALLTGLIVAMVLSPMEPWYVAAITSAIGVLSKYAIRAGKANVFSPAGFAPVATFYWFNTGQSWWGTLSAITPFALVLLFATGVFITDRVNEIPLVLSFLGAYYLLVAITAFAGRSCESCRAVPRAGSACGAVFRVFHWLPIHRLRRPNSAISSSTACSRRSRATRYSS